MYQYYQHYNIIVSVELGSPTKPGSEWRLVPLVSILKAGSSKTTKETRERFHRWFMKEPPLHLQFADNTGGNFVFNRAKKVNIIFQQTHLSQQPPTSCIHSSSLSVLPSSPCLPTRSLLSDTFPVLSIPFHLPMLKRPFVFQSRVGRVRLSFLKAFERVLILHEKGNLCDISRHVNRQSSEQGLTRQLLAANPMMADKSLWCRIKQSRLQYSSVCTETMQLHQALLLNDLKQTGVPVF